MRKSKLTQELIILGLTLLAFLLRAYQLGAQSYWIDEAWSVYFANLSIGELWQLLKTVEPLPPFYHPSTIYWVKLVGDGEYAFRFYSLVFGVLVVPFTYRLGRDLSDARLGLLAALLTAVAPYQIWHSQEARMYSALAAASAMSMWGFVNLWRRGGWRWWLVYVVGTEWAIMSHYHGVVVIGIQGLFVLLTWRRRWASRRFLIWGSGLAAVALLLLPWLYFGGNLLQSYLNWIEQPSLLSTYVRSSIAYSVGELVPRMQAIPLSLPFVILYILGLVYASRRSWGMWRGSEVLTLLLAYTLAPNLAAWAYGEVRTTVYYERYLIAVQTGFLLTVAAGLLAVADGLRHRLGRSATAFGALFACLLVGISAWVLGNHYFDPLYAKPNWRMIAQTVQDLELPGDAVIITGDGGEKVFDFYYQSDLPIYVNFNTPVPSENRARQIISAIAESHRRIWYTPYGVNIDAVLETWLSHNAYPAWQSWLGRKRLALYASSTVLTERYESLEHTFANSPDEALILNSVALPTETTAAGDLLPLHLTWSAATDLNRDYKLSLRLANQAGDIFAQSDWPPLAAAGGTSSWQPNSLVADRRALWLAPDIPPGDYLLQLVVYDPASGQPLGQPAVVPGVSVGPAKTVVPATALSIPNSTHQPVNGLNVIGYTLPESIKPGEELGLWLYWQAADPQTLSPDTTLRLSLTGDGETTSTDFSLIDSVGPFDTWKTGQVRRALYRFPTSPRLAGDRAQLGVALNPPFGATQAEITLTTIVLQTRVRQFEAPSIPNQSAIDFAIPPHLKLIGYDMPASPALAGEALPVTLYWQAEREMGINYTVFVQLLDSGWGVVAQVDSQPQSGAAPTTTWLPGEILENTYTLSLPADLAPGSYRLITGMYDPATGERMPVSTGGDFAELSTVTVQ